MTCTEAVGAHGRAKQAGVIWCWIVDLKRLAVWPISIMCLDPSSASQA
jgi:hypothetical protein